MGTVTRRTYPFSKDVRECGEVDVRDALYWINVPDGRESLFELISPFGKSDDEYDIIASLDKKGITVLQSAIDLLRGKSGKTSTGIFDGQEIGKEKESTTVGE
jgi:hypothetical protein